MALGCVNGAPRISVAPDLESHKDNSRKVFHRITDLCFVFKKKKKGGASETCSSSMDWATCMVMWRMHCSEDIGLDGCISRRIS